MVKPTSPVSRGTEGLQIRRWREPDSKPVWGFSCQAVVSGCAEVFCSERERPFFVPSPGIRFAERAEGVKGPKRQQSLAACRLSAACVSQRPLFKPGAGFDA